MFAIHIKADNDRNGNPRRLFLMCSQHGPVVAVNEGYEGEGAMDQAFIDGRTTVGRLPVVSTINVTPTEYKRILKQYPAGPVRFPKTGARPEPRRRY